ARCVPIRVANSPVFILPSVRPGAHGKQVGNLPYMAAGYIRARGRVMPRTKRQGTPLRYFRAKEFGPETAVFPCAS
ncbi:MAG TPA: hypothetical protein VKG25_09690, partial [Bryobacteraceae bacterium]|nr:hypothetical protein [Bryobacteraceae bacterium]